METVADARGDKLGARAALAARLTVQLSTVAAVVAGCWILSLGAPAIAALAAILFVSTLLLARWRFAVAGTIVLSFAYIHTGLVLLAAPALAAASLWLAALAGLVAGGCSWSKWESPAAWRWPLMLWLVGVAVSWPVIAAREADFAAVMPGSGVGVVLLNALLTLCSGLWLESALTWDLRSIERRIAMPLLVSVLIAAAAVFYQAVVDITWLSSEVWIQLQRAPGLMGDANPMAVAAALWAPLVALPFWRGHIAIRLTLTALLWSAAWLTGARSVILLIAAGVIGLTGGAMAARTSPRRALVIAAAAAVAALLIVVVLSRSGVGGPIARLASTLPLDRPLDLAYEVFWRRDGYGVAAVRAIREHPLSGVGTGAFYVVSPYYHQLEVGRAIPPDNAQNLWRHLLAERGLLAFAAVIAMTIATARLLLRPARGVPFIYTWTLKASVLGLGLVLTFGYPVQNAAIAITAASLLAWLNAAVRAPQAAPAVRTASGPVAAVWLLALAGVAVDAVHARGDLRPPWRAARVGDLYLYGFGEPERGPRGTVGRAVVHHAVVALRPTGPRYVLRLWVRGTDARHVRVWQNQRLIIDELLPAAVLIERTLDTSSPDGLMLEFKTDPPGIGTSGEFAQR